MESRWSEEIRHEPTNCFATKFVESRILGSASDSELLECEVRQEVADLCIRRSFLAPKQPKMFLRRSRQVAVRVISC